MLPGANAGVVSALRRHAAAPGASSSRSATAGDRIEIELPAERELKSLGAEIAVRPRRYRLYAGA